MNVQSKSVNPPEYFEKAGFPFRDTPVPAGVWYFIISVLAKF